MLSTMTFALGEDWARRTSEEMAQFAFDHREAIDRANRDGSFPNDVYAAMGERGWLGPITPAELGGLGGGISEYCWITEESARHALVSPQVSIQGQRWLLVWGTPEQKQRYLSGIARGSIVFSESVSEPTGASSLKALSTSARRVGDKWVLNGTKIHVNLGHQCDVTLVYAIAEGVGLTAFLVDMTLKGVESRQTDPIGLRSIPTSEIMLTDVVLPDEAVLGQPGQGLDTFLTTFNVSRLGNASEMIGVSRRALANAIEYARRREVGGAIVTSFQGIQWTIADCYSAIYGASLARDNAARLYDRGNESGLATSLAKKLSIEAGELTTNQVYALIGSHGLYTDTDFGQLLLDMKVYRVGGGSVEIMKNYISKKVLRDESLGGLR